MQPAPSYSDRDLLLRQTAAGLPTVEEQREFLQAAYGAEPALIAEILETLTIAETTSETAEPLEPLAPGDVLGERFHIVRQLGEGGMAVVYEAVDSKLMERRALKFPKRGHGLRIPDEARNALRVTHENICRTYEIHSTPASDFISMEMLHGETLFARSRRASFSSAAAIDIARQLCRGLAAAHAAHILHQDLKSNNVMLTSRVDGTLRVVITDFGLARPLGADSSSVAGTPHYIAPERWKGAPATPAADVYALGVILYEVLAGAMPFPRDAAWSDRLTALPPAPSRCGRGSDPRWDRIVLRCLEPDPAHRFTSAGAVLKAIDATFQPLYRRRSVVAAALVLLAASPVVAFRNRIWPPPLERLAILPFTGSSGDPRIDTAVKGALFDVTRQFESLGAKSQRLLVMPVEDSLRYGVTTPASAAARLGATHLLSGTIGARLSGFEVHAAVADALSGAVLRDFGGEFRLPDIGSLAAALAGVVTSAFSLNRPPDSPMNRAAYGEYLTGVGAMQSAPPDFNAAIAAFEAALQYDRTSAKIYARLADSYLRRYERAKDAASLDAARAAARRAETLQPDDPAVLLVLGSLAQTEGRVGQAIDLFRRAATLEPKNSEGWRRAGVAMQRAGRDMEAVNTLRQAIHIAPGYFATHLSLGFVYFRMGRNAAAADEFREVTRIAPGHPDAFSNLGGVLLTLERDGEAEAAFRRALEIRETRSTLNNLSVLLRYQHRDTEAVAVLERALVTGADDAGVRLNLANALRAAGRADAAHPHFEAAAALARADLHVNPANAIARARLSYAMLRLGETAIAPDEAVQAARLASSDYSVLFWCVMTLDAVGRRQDALALLASASQERLKDLRRQPDLADLTRDPAFLALVQNSTRKE